MRLNTQRVTSIGSNVKDTSASDTLNASSSSSSIPLEAGENHENTPQETSQPHHALQESCDARCPPQHLNDIQSSSKKSRIWSVSDMVSESSRKTGASSHHSAASAPDTMPHDPTSIFDRRSVQKGMHLSAVNGVFPGAGMVPVPPPSMRLPGAYVTNQPMFYLPGSSLPYAPLPTNHVTALSMRPQVGALKHS